MTRYKWVVSRKAEGFPTNLACRVAGVSTSAFYAWCERDAAGPTEAEQAEERLVAEMRVIHREMNGTYGEPRMTPELHARGFCVNHKRVARLMRKHQIVGAYKPRRARTTIAAEHASKVPDRVQREFAPGEPDRVWVGDITYIPTGQGWLYLASVIDLGSRRWLGYAMADHMRTELVKDAFDMATAARNRPVDGLVFHADRGCQYMSHDYQTHLHRHGVELSVGRTGVCWDNSVAESAWASLKRELVDRHRYTSHGQARRAIFEWINHYNQRRRHSTLGYVSPNQWETNYHQTQANQAA